MIDIIIFVFVAVGTFLFTEGFDHCRRDIIFDGVSSASHKVTAVIGCLLFWLGLAIAFFS